MFFLNPSHTFPLAEVFVFFIALALKAAVPFSSSLSLKHSPSGSRFPTIFGLKDNAYENRYLKGFQLHFQNEFSHTID